MSTARFIRRTVLLTGLVLAVIANTAIAAFTVNSAANAVDANPGNGVCATAFGACTLRAAIMEANAPAALTGADTIIALPTEHPVFLTPPGGVS